MSLDTALPITTDEATDCLDRLVEAFARTDTEAYFAVFDPEAIFVFAGEPEPLAGRAAYRSLWDGWVASGWRVASCESTERRVTLAGPVAIITHRVLTTTTGMDGDQRLDERESVVVARSGDGVVRVLHEHLSPTTSPKSTEESTR